MDSAKTRTGTYQSNLNQFADCDPDRGLTLNRLDALLAANSEVKRRHSLFKTKQEELKFAMMRWPLAPDRAFAYLGLLLGTFPPAALFARFIADMNVFGSGEVLLVVLFALANVMTAVAGYFSGKIVGKLTASIERMGWSSMILLLALTGLLWGAVSGIAGGIFIFVIGAFFGAFFGGAVGVIALPFFAVFHRILKHGDSIELKHFLPIAFGITLTICSFLLGL